MAKSNRSMPWSGFPAGLISIPVVAGLIVSCWFVARSRAEAGAFFALCVASVAAGGVVGFLVGSPGLHSGDDATDDANARGWASRLGVFGNWVTGAAFVLALTNAGVIADWFSRVTRVLSAREGATVQSNRLYQYALAAWMIAAVGFGFATGFMQMVTTGRTLIAGAASAAKKLEDAAAAAENAAKKAEAASEVAAEVAESAKQTSDSARAVVESLRSGS